MKIFTKRNILQKITIAILMVVCINFIVPTYSNADFGGVLVSPIVDFVCSLGDIVINLLQRTMTGEWGSEGATNMSLSAFLMPNDQYYDDPAYKKAELSSVSESNKVYPNKEFDKGWLGLKDEYYIPVATYSPEQIFSGNVEGLDINFINPNFEDGSAAELQGTIASWYVALRNLSIVGLLCVLVYVGIRIMLSSTAGDKAKYKQMFTDWIVALCILFFLHYIMSFVLTLTESVCGAIGGDGEYTISVYDGDAGRAFSTNLLGLARFKTQYKDFGQKCTYLLFYIALVVYTLIFTWHYLKRLIMMAFLTIIAPMVALTYPIDKMGDGRAQAFNMWLKEYIYNAILQPFHLIIYTVFVGSAIDLVQVNMLYALACMGFLLPAEKILKKLFGVDNPPLATMGALTGFTMGSLASKLGGSKGGSSNVRKENTNNEKSEDKPPRFERKHGTDGIEYPQERQLGTGQEDNSNMGEDNNSGEDNSNINSRAREELAKNNLSDEENDEYNRLKNDLDNADYNDMYLNPDKYEKKQKRYDELERQRLGQNEDEEQQGNHPIEVNEVDTRGKFRKGINNVISAHGGGKRIAIKGVKALGRVAKFTGRNGIKLAGTAAGIALGAGVGLASGKGVTAVLAGAAAGKKAGSSLGGKLGNTVTNLPGNVVGGVIKAKNGIASTYRREMDTFNGNTAKEDKARAKAFMKDASTEQYVRDKMTKENGTAPTATQLKQEMNSIQTYANEGMTDIAQIYRAKKAEKFASPEQCAKIALLAQDRKITSDVLGDEKKFNSRKEDFTQEFMDKGLSEEQAAKQADYVLNVMKAQVGQRHNLGQGGSTSSKSSSNTRTKKPIDGASNEKPTNNTAKNTRTASTNNKNETNSSTNKGTRTKNNNRNRPNGGNTSKGTNKPKNGTNTNRKLRTKNNPK